MALHDPTPYAEYLSLSLGQADHGLKALRTRSVRLTAEFKSGLCVLPQGSTTLQGILAAGSVAEEGGLIVTRLAISDEHECTLDLALTWFVLAEEFEALRHADASLLFRKADSAEEWRIRDLDA